MADGGPPEDYRGVWCEGNARKMQICTSDVRKKIGKTEITVVLRIRPTEFRRRPTGMREGITGVFGARKTQGKCKSDVGKTEITGVLDEKVQTEFRRMSSGMREAPKRDN